MTWASPHLAKLQRGETAQFRPRGQSMKGRIPDGALCTVEPLPAEEPPAHALAVGDVVLCRVQGRHVLHLIKAIQGPRFLIGNNRGGTNGWITRRAIFGRCVQVEP